MKKALIIILLSIAGLTSIGAAIHSNPSISQFDYYENAPFSPIATVSKEKEEEIKKIINNRKEKERRDKISNEYKKLIEEEKRLEQERLEKRKEQERIEEAKRIEKEKIEEEKRLKTEQEAIQENKKNTENTNTTVETTQKEDSKMVSGNVIENPLIEVKDLSASDKTIAYRIIEAIKNGEREVYFEQEDFEHIFNIVQAIEDEYFYVGSASALEVEEYTDGSVKVFIPSYALENYNKGQYIANAVKSLSNSLKGLTEKEAVKRLNDWIVNNVSYSENVRDMYSLTYSHIGNCDSYSQMFELVCDELGIESKSVEGNIKGVGPHMWNIVKIDGVWYYIDTTFNQTYNNEYFLSTSLWTETHEEWKQFKREWSHEE